MTPANDQEFIRGVELFNDGRFFEAHEVWENLWKAAQEPERSFYQGLILAAAALLHRRRGNEHGARSTFIKASTRLAPYPELYGGINVEEFRVALTDIFTRRTGPGVDSTREPKLKRVNPSAPA